MPADTAERNGFDKLAPLYRWMEYLSFGPLLWRTRVAYLPQIDGAREALVLGDGDGRFTAALLRRNRQVHICAVDASGRMLRRLRQRAAKQGNASRVLLLHADATAILPQGPFDLVCSHFFLDCLSDAQCCLLAAAIAERIEPSGCWIISEFAVPAGRLRWLAGVLVRGLYAAFGLLTGLRVKQLPDYAAALLRAGFTRAAVQTKLGGILRAELWRLRPPGSPDAPRDIS